MPLKKWIQYLPDGFTLRILGQTERGRLTAFSVVLVYGDECITRYDTGHGFAPRDLLGRKSALIEKRTCENVSNEAAFQDAVNDLKTNYRAHLAFYLAH